MDEIVFDEDIVRATFDDDAASTFQVADFVLGDGGVPNSCEIDTFFAPTFDEIADDFYIFGLRDFDAVESGVQDCIAFDDDISDEVREIMSALGELDTATIIGAVDCEVSYDDIVSATSGDRRPGLICRHDVRFSSTVGRDKPNWLVIQATFCDLDILVIGPGFDQNRSAGPSTIGCSLDRCQR